MIYWIRTLPYALLFHVIFVLNLSVVFVAFVVFVIVIVVIDIIFTVVVVIIHIYENKTKKKKCLRQDSNPLDQTPKILAFLLLLVPMLFSLSLQFLAVRLWRHL